MLKLIIVIFYVKNSYIFVLNKQTNRNIMNSVILYYKKSKGQIDINNSKLFIGNNEYLIQHLTKGGYFSKLELLPFFNYEETTDGDNGQECLFITDEVAEMILKSNCNLKGKIWDNYETPIYENIAARNEVKYSNGVSMECVKGIDY